MKRSVRLYLLVQRLGGGRGWRPEEIAEHFEISVRTAYRDLADLSSTYGIPVTTDDDGLTLALDNPALRTAPDVASAINSLI